MNKTFPLMAALLMVLLPGAAVTQIDPATMLAGTTESEILIERRWLQFRGKQELYFFTLDVIVTVILTGLIVYHPVRRRARRSVSDIVMPRLFFLYALVGMAVGFLVVQHGSMIGFVIFGIGALLRFRSNMDDPVDTVEMIIVTVLGLAVGLGLPLMATLVAVVCWCFIWLGGRNKGVEISLKASDEEHSLKVSGAIEAMAADAGWKLVRKHHVPGKSRVSLLFITSGGLSEARIEEMINDLVPEKVELKLNF
ncbi:MULTISPECIES: hypothetical protein [unclassified Ruegeria]|uniref:hypothetical protein n=3 Tax=Ruegeria TaxID=97050 RepID=UPI00147CCCCD|nr:MULTISPECIES: hypothetical protein [unclassified Ruegeria]NOD49985.1 hypothetical protein [Ruegeria sp. HKCCD5849]NOD54275.1 hypothetical protein [Ruegeria sp. HKCCD5851]